MHTTVIRIYDASSKRMAKRVRVGLLIDSGGFAKDVFTNDDGVAYLNHSKCNERSYEVTSTGERKYYNDRYNPKIEYTQVYQEDKLANVSSSDTKNTKFTQKNLTKPYTKKYADSTPWLDLFKFFIGGIAVLWLIGSLVGDEKTASSLSPWWAALISFLLVRVFFISLSK